MKNSYIIFSTIAGLFAVTESSDWGYWGDHDPVHWPGLCATGKHQSPIDISTKTTVKKDFCDLTFRRYEDTYHADVINNGHSVQLNFDRKSMFLSGGGLPSTYVLEQIHFHWPAEHTVNGVRDALEVHFVHYELSHQNVAQASQYKDGITVIATLFELSKEDNADIMHIVKVVNISNSYEPNTKPVSDKVVPSLLFPKNHSTFYRYNGSLTTPDCLESVTWVIFTEKLTISKQQLHVFESVKAKNGTLSHNYRPTQDLGDRKVYLRGIDSSVAMPTSNLMFTLLSFMFIKLLCS
ncbi:putative carbonic anhydrase 3 [Megalopta genalis]|uniref:putative carbonic anhydrase 3 n=1 Tax=Megalopta genalis TaxID=115081 RepID=UPI003FD59509